MQTDRELIEAAAKVAGIVGPYVERKSVMTDCGRRTFTGIMVNSETVWNPLFDQRGDNDAFRDAFCLAVELGLLFDPETSRLHSEELASGAEPLSAACRAITKAAANMAY